eukprot:7109114-Prorocentrum_lima.AAC.1
MPSDGRSPRQGASNHASQPMGRITYLIEHSRHVVDMLVMEEQDDGRQQQQVQAMDPSQRHIYERQ